MTPYPAYKPTGLPWLPQIPEHWEIKKLRTLLSVVSEKGHPDAPLLSVVRERGVIIRNTEDNSENHNYIPDELTKYKYVRKGQFAMNKMKAWQGSYGISNFDGIVSPAYFVFNLKEVTKNFFNLAIRSKFYVPYFGQASDGIRNSLCCPHGCRAGADRAVSGFNDGEDQQVDPREEEADRPAAGTETGDHQPGSHKRSGPQRRNERLRH